MSVYITALYCYIDDFCKLFDEWEAYQLIPSETIRRRAGPPTALAKTASHGTCFA